MPIAIRRAGPEDAALLSELRLRAHVERHSGHADESEFLVECEAFFARTLAEGTVRAWLAFDGDRPVGVAALHVLSTFPRLHGRIVSREGRDARVRNVYVDPALRRRGIASRLMREVIAEAERERIDRLALGTSEMGRALYERLGFTRKEDEMLYLRAEAHSS